MKKLFTVLALLGGAFYASAQTIYFQEDFNAGLPGDWTADADWLFDTPSAVSSQFFPVPAADGNVACFNDDGLGNGQVGGGAVVTGEIDLSTATIAFLEMNSYFPNIDYQGNDETAKILISTNGTDWTEIADLAGGEGAEFGVAFADISAYTGGSVWLQFVYDDGNTWNYGWAFDNVTIADQLTLISPRSFGIHAGGSTMMDQALDGIEYFNSGYIYNEGIEDITSYDLEMTNGTEVYTQSVTGVSIPYNTTARYTFDQGIVVSGNQTWTVSLTNVNGSSDPDDDVTNDAMSFNLNAVTTVNEHKGVMVEEATGTWCTWCPRGTVFMDEMSKRFGDHFAGVAVHNGDPMVLAAYDNAVTSFPGFQGFPSVVYQRESILDPSAIVNPSIAEMAIAPPAALTLGAELNGSSLTTSLQVSFLEDITADYRIAIVLTEDGLTGTTSDWAQINAYSGGGQGPMGGFEILPGAVPAELMVYDHVGRALIGSFAGVADTIVGEHLTGDVMGYVFGSYALPAAFDTDNLHIIGVLINSSTGEIVNAFSSSLADAIDNGLYQTPVGTVNVYDSNLAEVHPNPVKDIATIYMAMDESRDVSVSVMNSLGQQVSMRHYGEMSGEFNLEYDMTNLVPGVYFMHIQADNKFISKKITKVN
jgi:type IX secretion system substrate protein